MSRMIYLKTKEEIEKMRRAGQIVAAVFEAVQKELRPGVTTAHLDKIAHHVIVSAGARPSFLHYGDPPFPGSICASVNDVVVHGIPSSAVVLKEGDIISVDVGACLDGWHGDAARTFAVGTIDPEVEKLVRVTEESFYKGLEFAKPGCRLGDLQAAIQQHAESHGYGVVRELTGHGIGRDLHEAPDIPNYGKAGRGLRLEAGMVIAVEPMITMGTYRIYVDEDEWTIHTADGKPAAHYENTIAITEDGPVLLTI